MDRCPRRRTLVTAVLAVALGLSACSPGATPVSTPSPTSPAPTSPAPTSVPPTSPAPTSPAPTSPAPTSPSPTPLPLITQKKPGLALDRIDQHTLPLDQRFTTVASQGRGVTVYVVDGLFDVRNPEFGGRASTGLKVGQPCVLEDATNHGLFVAGLVAGQRTGVAKQAKIVLVGSSYGCEGVEQPTEAQAVARIVAALDWVALHARRPAVVNLSLNVNAPSPKVKAAVGRLTAAGLSVVASAGNQGEDACQHPPAGLSDVVTVAAATKTDRDVGFNHGRCVDLFAPGEGVTSVADGDRPADRLVTNEFAATSWAAPLASGAAALYLADHRDANPHQVRAWLIDHASTGVLKGNLHGSPNRLLFTGGPS